MSESHWFIVTLAVSTLACGDTNGRGDEVGLDSLSDGSGTADETAEETADTGEGCMTGSACEGGVCVDGACCPTLQGCGTICCGDTEVCSFGLCVAPGAECENSEDCPVGEYCELGGEGQQPAPGCLGGEILVGNCLPEPPVCQGGEQPGPGGLPTCVDVCEAELESSDLSTVLEHEVEGPGYTAPVVMQLDDDDCDGFVTARDVPEIIWTMHTGANYEDPTNGRIKAISIVEDVVVEKFVYDTVLPLTQLAAGNVDGDPSNGNEVVACASDSSVIALANDGSTRWKAGPNTCGTAYPGASFLLSVPNLADLDHDGIPEVVTERAILDGASGTTEQMFAAAVHGTVAVSDVDGDGWLDIVSGGQVFDRFGAVVVQTGNANLIWPAVGDLDGNGSAEIVAVNFTNRTLAMWRVSAGAVEMIRPALSLDASGLPACAAGSGAGGNGNGGGPPTIGDFDGDGTADVALATGNAYVVFDGAGLMNPALAAPETVLWAMPTNDCSSAQTGSTLFDFDGNGRVEAVYGDQEQLRIYDGLTGAIVAEHPHPTGTINEYPVVADVDADGQADIVAITRLTCEALACGHLRVYGSATGGWVRTRRVWNQHTYHVTNVDDDGSIPPNEPANWTVAGLNNFRQNKQPGGEFSASDAAVTLQPACYQGYSLHANVRNLGQAPIPAGAVVTFFAGPPGQGVQLGQLSTTTTLYPAQSQVLTLPLDSAPDADVIHATVASEVPECKVDNNTSEAVDPTCVPVG
jgi:hypothetical protein